MRGGDLSKDVNGPGAGTKTRACDCPLERATARQDPPFHHAQLASCFPFGPLESSEGGGGSWLPSLGGLLLPCSLGETQAAVDCTSVSVLALSSLVLTATP